MSAEGVLRRSSYGPTSPMVGQRGARTRERIVSEALTLFAAQGFHGTSVHDISAAAEISRATFYQYFESKEEIFVQLLDECGGALVDVVRQLGPLGPTAEGFGNLYSWLLAWGQIYDKYSTMFVQWANVDSSGTAIRPLVTGFVESFDARVARRLKQTDLEGLSAPDAAVVLTSVVNRFNYLRHVTSSPTTDLEGPSHHLAVILQTVLFPSTPVEVTRRALGGQPDWSRPRAPSAAAGAAPVPGDVPDRFTPLTARGATTVRELMDAGGRVFAERGYQRANVDDIVGVAGFARGTFYKYFDEKLDLLVALSDQCRGEAVQIAHTFEDVEPGDGEALRAWLTEYVDFHSRYVGVIRVWLERTPNHPALDRDRVLVLEAMRRALYAHLERVPRSQPLDLRVAEVFQVALLERLPETYRPRAKRGRTPQMVELMAQVLERGLFTPR
ncbi:TetR/AcrR family transcriptional regulator [uncultured Modestobacter sp.]|uniref:TetR/AcrR family transcriptional regulator n=1 Tax=uncultured Modestobacter sp. TaxID=380048 RepID=UPI00261B9EB8|nr:TetR/AcrR family transcriptional regulator [uncultured Modestobacter sp.]